MSVMTNGSCFYYMGQNQLIKVELSLSSIATDFYENLNKTLFYHGYVIPSALTLLTPVASITSHAFHKFNYSLCTPPKIDNHNMLLQSHTHRLCSSAFILGLIQIAKAYIRKFH